MQFNAFVAGMRNWASLDHEKRKSKFTSMFSYFLTQRFSLVLFLMAVIEGSLWLYPIYCNSTSYIMGPPQSFENTSLQDYFQNNLARFRNSDFRGVAAEQAEVRSRLHSEDIKKETEFMESLKLHSLEVPNSKPQKHEFRGAEVVLLLLLTTLQSAGSSEANESARKRKLGIPKSARVALLAVVVLSLPALAVGTSVSVVPPTQSTCDLECWLSALVINVPDQVFKTSFLGISIDGTIKNFSCSQITIGGISTSIIPPTGLSSDVTGLGINCAGDWSYTFGLLNGHGTVSANATNSALSVEVMIAKTSDGLLANSTSLTKCNPNLVLSNLNFQGGISGDILEAISVVVLPLLDYALNDVVCAELKTLVNVNLTNAIQGIDEIIRPYLPPVPPQPPPAVPEGSMNFKVPPNPLIALLDYILDDVVGIEGPLNVNKIINLVTGGTGALTISEPCLEGGLFSMPLVVPTLGTVTVGICTIQTIGLNTWDQFDVLKPIPHTNHSLGTHTGLSELSLNVTFFVNVSVDGNGTLSGKSLYEEGILTTTVRKNHLSAATVVALNGKFFDQLQVPNDLLAPNGVCIARELWTVNITQLEFNVSVDEISVIALGGEKERQIDETISIVVGLLISTFNSAIPALLNGVVAGPLREQVNVLVMNQLEAMHEASLNGTVTCGLPEDIPETFSPDATIISFGITLGIAFALTIYALIVLAVAAKADESSQDPTLQWLLNEGSINATKAPAKKGLGTRLAVMLSTCLAMDRRLHWIVRYGIIFLILLNIGLFLSSNTSTGASVVVVLQLGEETKELPPVFSFSLTSSVEDMWNAKVYVLSILIALFSGGWPYLKLVLMLVCWVLPTKLLSVRGREIFLMVLDALGKWSLIDTFVMVLMMTTFSLEIDSPNNEGIVHVYVQPNYGIHTFILATMVSLALTHIILAFHRRVTRLSMEEGPSREASSNSILDPDSETVSSGGINDDSDDYEVATLNAAATGGYRALFLRGDFGRWNKLVGAVIALLLLISFCLLIPGAVIDSFRFEIQGMAGAVVDFLGGSSVRTYSLIDVGLDLPSSVMEPNGIQVRWIQGTYFVLVLGIPLATLILLAALWLIPMSFELQRSVFHATEVLHAWSSLEVYLLAVVAALLEIQQFAQFIIGDKCDLINNILKKYFGDVLDEPVCFNVDTVLITSFWFLLGAALIYMGTAILVLWVCHKALEKHDEREKRKRRSVRG